MRDLELPEFIERAGEVWLSCMLFMVQGNLSEITMKHGITAFKVSLGVMESLGNAGLSDVRPAKPD